MANVKSRGASKIAKSAAAVALSTVRKWTKEYHDHSVAELIASDQSAPDDDEKMKSDESAVSKRSAISIALSKQLDEIKAGIDSLRNKDYETAKKYFIDGIQCRQTHPKEFRERMKGAMDLCISALSTVEEGHDRIQVYSLFIAVGFIHRSGYGENLPLGLRTVHHILNDMNHDPVLRKELRAVLDAKLFGKGQQREFLKAVLEFSTLVRVFVFEVQKCCDSLTEAILAAPQEMLKLKAQESESELGVYLRDDWLPRYWTGFYFGNTGKGAFKSSVISMSDFKKLMNISAKEIEAQFNDELSIMGPVITVSCVTESDDDMKAEQESVHEFKLFLEFKNDLKVSEMKQKICEKSKKLELRVEDPELLFLRFNDVALKDGDKAISEYGILPGDEIRLLLRVELAVHGHRGHHGDYHPKNLLDGRSDTRYGSKAGKPDEDWIEFTNTSGKSVRPTLVMLRNGSNSYALKSIMVGCSADKDTWQTLRQIDGIKQDSEKRQYFSIDAQTGRALKEKMKFLKLHKFKNDGADWNRFYEFGVFGVPE